MREGSGVEAPPIYGFVPVDGREDFILETAGTVTRLWHDPCDNFTGLADLPLSQGGRREAIVRACGRHRCGSRTSGWEART